MHSTRAIPSDESRLVLEIAGIITLLLLCAILYKVCHITEASATGHTASDLEQSLQGREQTMQGGQQSEAVPDATYSAMAARE